MTVLTAIVDTDVFSCLYVLPRGSDPLTSGWKDALADRRVIISFQTRAEFFAGARQRGWGTPRVNRLQEIMARTPTIHSDNDVVDAYVNLSAECRELGHALHEKIHTADRWIAACAIAKGLELFSGDAIFQGVPNLNVHS
ncbi:PIN domain-containing protein [Mycolicibacterium fortuitum]|uniref:PIN domain-containing protein n=2 Tax=Mycolicibacterium fortuitum TaxID=1766 RepID=A0AAE4VDJ8_MYCFO|nr:PIN domain-containing protein [Mycolicibacterium fortuitum]MCV7139663.1 PIN domain-containing protein [Mycolicibacterium fortuitum]MDV7193026.1 PIN domain-containing protein [Mycolicibacterium fortuitum]MDV7206099.1 PIN domain-containing protein [Mycolicibacterium fortuitum]MDV7227741.1 PIN domain-containing protein [Mycolicibacterium fortuitum]MDV7260172.1 PIN domain-containing protein [Mycolicibacterium fortuitum]